MAILPLPGLSNAQLDQNPAFQSFIRALVG